MTAGLWWGRRAAASGSAETDSPFHAAVVEGDEFLGQGEQLFLGAGPLWPGQHLLGEHSGAQAALPIAGHLLEGQGSLRGGQGGRPALGPLHLQGWPGMLPKKLPRVPPPATPALPAYDWAPLASAGTLTCLAWALSMSYRMLPVCQFLILEYLGGSAGHSAGKLGR